VGGGGGGLEGARLPRAECSIPLVPAFLVDIWIVCSIVCCFPCAFSLAVASSLTSLFVRRPDFLGFSGGISPSSFSCRHCTCRFELEVSCCAGVFVSSVEGSSVSGSSLMLIRGGSGNEEGNGAEGGFCFEEDSPRSSKGLLLGGGLVIGGGAFLGGDFGLDFALKVLPEVGSLRVLHEIHCFYHWCFFCEPVANHLPERERHFLRVV
jgi:hypothetical protein